MELIILSHKKLLDFLDYNPLTGIFVWKKTRTFTAKCGTVAGSIGKIGYRIIRIDTHRIYAQRLAWFYMFKEWPTNQIDHINRIKDDNRICNLREATPAQNQMNNGCRRNNTSGLKGVRNFKGKWRATIGFNNKIIHLGTFETKLKAYEAYCKTATKLHGEFARFE